MMKKFRLFIFTILFTIVCFLGGVTVYASSFEAEAHLQTNLESDKSFSIVIGFSGKNIMAIQNKVSYESEKLVLLSVESTDGFNLTYAEPKDDNEYKVFKMVADSNHVYQNINYAVLRFQVTDDFKVGSAARIFFDDYLAAGPFKTEFVNEGFYYTITRDDDLSISAMRKTITDSTKYIIWLEDNFSFIIGGLLGFLAIIFILTHLPTGKLENRERKVIKKNKKVKKDKKSGYYDKDAAIPEFKENKVKDKIDVVPFNPFNSNPSNFSGTNNQQTNGNNNPQQNNNNQNQFFNPLANNQQPTNNQPQASQSDNPFGQPFTPINETPNNGVQQFDPLGGQTANSNIDPNAKTIEPMFMKSTVNNNKNNNFNKFFDDEDYNPAGNTESNGLFSVPPIEEEKAPLFGEPDAIPEKAKEETPSLNAFNASPDEELEELDVQIDDKHDDDMDILVFILLLILPVGLLFFNNVKAEEYKVEDLRKCIVGISECTEDLNYSKNIGNESDSAYTVLDLIYTKDLAAVQKEIVADEDIPTITTAEITFPTAPKTTTTTTKPLGENKYNIVLKKINSTTDDQDDESEVQENGNVVFAVTPKVGYGASYTLECDKTNVKPSYLEMEGKVIIDNVEAGATCTINFKVNEVNITLKETYNIQDEEDPNKKIQSAKDVPVSGVHKYGDPLELNVIDIPGYEFKTVTCTNNNDINIVNVEGNKIVINELTPADGRNLSCSLEFTPIQYNLTFKFQTSEVQTYKVEYRNEYDLSVQLNSKFSIRKIECNNGQSFNVVGTLDGNVKKYTIKYKHESLNDVACSLKE